MKLTDKRFWIFEGFTIVYAIVCLSLFDLMYGKTVALEVLFSLVGISCISGLITWLLGNGKHWLVFGLIYEGVQMFIISALCWIWAILVDGYEITDLFLDLDIFFVFMIAVATFSIIPTLALAFFGYRLFQKNETRNEDAPLRRH